MRVIGLDPAWGRKNPDGLCLIEGNRIIETQLLPSSETAVVIARLTPHHVAIDAPIVVPNALGGRPIDALITSHFHHFKIACYPGNQKNCARILELVASLKQQGYRPSLSAKTQRALSEVYPHLSIVRLFGLPERLLYKKGLVAQKRTVFSQLQHHLRDYLTARNFELSSQVTELLRTPWTKGIEDQTDALICALTAHLHVSSEGKMTESLGDLETGFIVYPRERAHSTSAPI